MYLFLPTSINILLDASTIEKMVARRLNCVFGDFMTDAADRRFDDVSRKTRIIATLENEVRLHQKKQSALAQEHRDKRCEHT